MQYEILPASYNWLFGLAGCFSPSRRHYLNTLHKLLWNPCYGWGLCMFSSFGAIDAAFWCHVFGLRFPETDIQNIFSSILPNLARCLTEALLLPACVPPYTEAHSFAQCLAASSRRKYLWPPTDSRYLLPAFPVSVCLRREVVALNRHVRPTSYPVGSHCAPSYLLQAGVHGSSVLSYPFESSVRGRDRLLRLLPSD